jgi:hypothetical protein
VAQPPVLGKSSTKAFRRDGRYGACARAFSPHTYMFGLMTGIDGTYMLWRLESRASDALSQNFLAFSERAPYSLHSRRGGC